MIGVPTRLRSTKTVKIHDAARSPMPKYWRRAGRAGPTMAMSRAPMRTPKKSRVSTRRVLAGASGVAPALGAGAAFGVSGACGGLGSAMWRLRVGPDARGR